MSGPWLVDSSRIATKIKSASTAYDPRNIEWKSNPTKSCPNCQYVMDNNDIAYAWPGLPRGVKFDPSDQEIIWHLLSKVGDENVNPHPFIDEFIPTITEDEGICYTHPQNLPGMKLDGSVSHFFYRAIKAYNTGTRKRRKINDNESGDVRWHKTGRTKPVLIDGVHKGCKKIMVLYDSSMKSEKGGKTNWVMHQYHLGTAEDEREGEYVISKVFYQQQQPKQNEKTKQGISQGIQTTNAKAGLDSTHKSVTLDVHTEPGSSDNESLQDSRLPTTENHNEGIADNHLEAPSEQSNGQDLNMEDDFEAPSEQSNGQDQNIMWNLEAPSEQSNGQDLNNMDDFSDQLGDQNADEAAGEGNWWDNEDQYVLSSQQLVEELSICDEFLQSQSPNRDGGGNGKSNKVRLADYACLGPEDLKRDLEECQKLPPSYPGHIVIDSPPEVRLSQPEFGSQDSYIAWGGSFKGGRVID